MTSQLKRQIQHQIWLPQLVAGLLLGLTLAVDAIAIGLILFSGTSISLLPIGINLALLSATFATLFITFSSSLTIAGVVPSFEAAAIMATVVGAMSSNLAEPAAVPTILATIGISSILTGGLLFTIGQFRLSRILRFMPYPVLCGFLASTGWIIIQGAVSISIGEIDGAIRWSQLWQGTTGWQTLAAIAFVGMLLWSDRRFTQFWVKPCLLIGAILSSHLLLALSQVPLSEAVQQGWFLTPLEVMHVGQAVNLLTLFQIDWISLLQNSSNLASILIIVPLVIILELTGLEIVLKRDIQIDHELKINGIANVIIGLCSSPICHYDLTNTLINQKAGATSRFAGVFAALFTGAILLIGGGLLAYLPTFVVVALTLVVGVDLVIEWLYHSRSQLPWSEYILVLGIFAVVVIFGLLPGIGIGILAACLLFAINYSRLSGVRSTRSGKSHHSRYGRSIPQMHLLKEEGQQIYILDLQGFIFFGTANILFERIHQHIKAAHSPSIKYVILNFRLVTGLDSSATLSFIKLKQIAQKQHLNLLFTQLPPIIQQQLQNSGCLQSDDEICHVFPDLDCGVEWCENQILESISWRRKRSLPLILQLDSWFPNVTNLSDIVDYLEEMEIDTGYALFHEEEPVMALYLIESGQITVWAQYNQQNARRVQTLGAGSLVGEMEFFLETLHQTSAVTDVSSTVYCLSLEAFTRMQQEAPQTAIVFQKAVNYLLAERLSYAYQEIDQLLY